MNHGGGDKKAHIGVWRAREPVFPGAYIQDICHTPSKSEIMTKTCDKLTHTNLQTCSKHVCSIVSKIHTVEETKINFVMFDVLKYRSLGLN